MASHINADLYEDRDELIALYDDVNHIMGLLDEINALKAQLNELLDNGPRVLADCKKILMELMEEIEFVEEVE